MKDSQMFRSEGNLEERTKELLQEHNRKIVLNDYKRVHYCMDSSRWILDYGIPEKGDKWVLAEQEAYARDWIDCRELNEKSKEILAKLLEPLVCLFNMREKEYSLESDNIKKVLDKYAGKLPKESKKIDDEKYGSGKITFYKRGNVLIELREFEKLDLGVIK